MRDMMKTTQAIPRGLALILACGLVGACAATPGASATPVAAPTTSAAAPTASVAEPSATPGPTPTPLPSVAIPEGTYTTIATREDALRIPWDDDCALKQDGAHITLKLASGKWTQSESCKTVPVSVGAEGTYTSTADTLVLRDGYDGSTSTWTWTLDGTKLTLRLRIDGADESATRVGRFIFEHEFDTSVAAPSAASGPTPTPLPSVATVTWSTPLDGNAFAPICQIAVDPKGRIWAPEANADKIAIFSRDGKLLEEWGESGRGPGQFDFTRGDGDGYGTLAFAKDGSFFVLDVGNHRVQHFDADRRFLRAWGGIGNRPGQFQDPVGIAVAPDGTVWVLDDKRSVVEHYRPDGKVIGSFDPFANQPVNGEANSLAIDAHGQLYVSEVGPPQIAVFDPDGTFVRFVGAGAFNEQAGDMAIDADGRVFVTQGPERGRRRVSWCSARTAR